MPANAIPSDVVSWFLPAMAKAIKIAESDPTGNMGVRSKKTSNPSKTLNESVLNNYNRWSSGQTPAPWIGRTQAHPDKTPFNPTKFVDFMHRRWAPIGAENDKKVDGQWLNSHWDNNVRGALKRYLTPEQYEAARRYNLVLREMPWIQNVQHV